MAVISLRGEDCLVQLHGGDSYFQFHDDIKTLGLFFFFLRANFMYVIYVSVTASLWSPPIYTHQQDFIRHPLVPGKQSCMRTLSPALRPCNSGHWQS